MNLLQELEQKQLKPADKIPKFNVGDTVRVHFRIVEGDKQRIQIFEGVVISRKGREGPMARYTVRRVVFGEGVERVFPLHSPRVEQVVVVREGRVRRAKLHYLRERVGKAARVRTKGRTSVSKTEAAAVADASEASAGIDESAGSEESAGNDESAGAEESSGTKEE